MSSGSRQTRTARGFQTYFRVAGTIAQGAALVPEDAPSFPRPSRRWRCTRNGRRPEEGKEGAIEIDKLSELRGTHQPPLPPHTSTRSRQPGKLSASTRTTRTPYTSWGSCCIRTGRPRGRSRTSRKPSTAPPTTRTRTSTTASGSA